MPRRARVHLDGAPLHNPAHYLWSSYRHNGLGQAVSRLTPHALYRGLGRTDKERQASYRSLFRTELDRGAVDDIRLAINQNQLIRRGFMTPEESRLELESSKFALDKEKFAYAKQLDLTRLASERRTRFWSQFATFIPILAVVAGFYANSRLESGKQTAAAAVEVRKAQREFISRQLSDLYYPIELRLRKDTETWNLAGQLSTQNRANTSEEFSRYVEESVLIPNHEEIVRTLDSHFDLLTNAWESYDPKALVAAIGQYERHVAAYKSLRAVHIYSLNPIQVCDTCAFPAAFPKLISARIADLEKQRTGLYP